MKFHSRWGRLWLLALALALCFIAAAQAAPDRLNDDVPDAFMDEAGSFSFSYSHEALKLEGPLSDDTIGHDYFKLRYTLNPKTAIAFRYGSHDLNGGLGLANPLFDNRDGGESFNFDLRLNLLTVPAIPADSDNNKEFEAGSAFGVGVSGTFYQMDMGDLASEDSLLRAYLLYTTDLSPEMRAHTIFTTSRLSGDTSSGSVNRIGAGLDYTLIDGSHPLTLMANGVLDVYNFRQPDFNTSRISRFDVGLRYRVARGWYASLGYTTYNDSENDASGSGVFASMQFLEEPKPCVTCEVLPEEVASPETQPGQAAVPAPQAAPPQTVPPEATTQAPLMKSAGQKPADKPAQDVNADKAAADSPPKEEQSPPPEAAESKPAESPAEADAAEDTAATAQEESTAGSEESPAASEDKAATEDETQTPPEETEETSTDSPPAQDEQKEAAAIGNDELGIQIPALAEDRPRQTPVGAVMVRAAGSVVQAMPHQTSPDDILLRAPGNSTGPANPDEIASADPDGEEPPAESALLAMRTILAAPFRETGDQLVDGSDSGDNEEQGDQTDQSAKTAATQDG